MARLVLLLRYIGDANGSAVRKWSVSTNGRVLCRARSSDGTTFVARFQGGFTTVDLDQEGNTPAPDAWSRPARAAMRSPRGVCFE